MSKGRVPWNPLIRKLMAAAHTRADAVLAEFKRALDGLNVPPATDPHRRAASVLDPEIATLTEQLKVARNTASAAEACARQAFEVRDVLGVQSATRVLEEAAAQAVAAEAALRELQQLKWELSVGERASDITT